MADDFVIQEVHADRLWQRIGGTRVYRKPDGTLYEFPPGERHVVQIRSRDRAIETLRQAARAGMKPNG